jgi:simple sugar transport system substrate-binding protein
MTRKTILLAGAAAIAVGLGAAGAATAQDTKPTIATIVKISGIQWFNRMDEGVKKFAADTGANAFQVGPAKADAQLQVQLVEDMIAQGVNAIAIVPFAPEAVEPVLKKAMDAGIKVVSHEASAIQNADYDIEAFQNGAYGEHLMKALGECMGGKGEYAVFVGSLTSKSHNEWVDGAIAYQKANFPEMTMVGSKNETFDDQQQAYAKTQELLRAFPNVRGFQGSASTDVGGIGLALEERGMADDTCVMGTSLPSIASQYPRDRRRRHDLVLGPGARRLRHEQARRHADRRSAGDGRHGSRRRGLQQALARREGALRPGLGRRDQGEHGRVPVLSH